MAEPALKLEYSTRRRPRWRRWVVWLVVIGLLSTAGWWFGPAAREAFRERYETWRYQRAYDQTKAALLTNGVWLADEDRPEQGALALRQLQALFQYYKYSLDGPVTSVLFIRSGETDVPWILFGYTTPSTLETVSFERKDRHYPLVISGMYLLPNPKSVLASRSTTTDGGLTFLTAIQVDGVNNEIRWTYDPNARGSWGAFQNRSWVYYDCEPLTGWSRRPGSHWYYDSIVALHEAPAPAQLLAKDVERLTIMPDGKLGVIRDGALHPLDLPTGKWGEAVAPPEPDTASDLKTQRSPSPDRRLLVTTDSNGVQATDVASGNVLFQFRAGLGANFMPTSPIRWSQDGRLAGVAADDGAYVWTMSPPYHAVRYGISSDESPFGGGGRGDTDLAISPDGQWFAVSSSAEPAIAYWPKLPAPLLPPKP